MKRASDAEQVAEPIFAVAIVLAERDLGELHALLGRLAPESASIIVWRPEAEPLQELAARPLALEGSRFFVQTLADGDALEAGVLYLAPAQAQIWCDGRLLRMASVGSHEPHGIDRFLQSFADCWGQRAIAIMPRALAVGVSVHGDGHYDGARGLAAIQAVRGIALGPEAFEPGVPPGAPGTNDPWSRRSSTELRGSSPATQPLESAPGAVRGRLPRLFPLSPARAAVARAAAAAAVASTSRRGHLRVWVPGCKTGTVVYAVAMLLFEAIASQDSPISLQVFGTDPDEQALAIARLGRYPTRAALDLDPALRGRYTFDEGDTIRVTEDLRGVCVFSSHKLTRDAPLSRMDLVVCHRVLDSLTRSKRERVLGALAFALKDDGLLLALDQDEGFPTELFELLEAGYFRARPWRAKALPPFHLPALEVPRVPRPAAHPSFGRPLELDQARTAFEQLVHQLGAPLILCDEELRLVEVSAQASALLPLSDGDRGQALSALGPRLPGCVDLVHAARRVLSSKAPQALTIRSSGRSLLARLSSSAHPAGRGVAIVLTDVSALEAAKARAVAQQHQQAAVARVGALALSPAPQSEVFEEALSVLFGNVQVCSAGVILEHVQPGGEPNVVASRGLGLDPLSVLNELGAPGQLLAAASARATLMVHPPVGSTESAAPLAAIACPIVHEGDVLGMIALYARHPGIDDPDHRHFVQAVANVLGGAILRHRTRRRITLELELGSALASATDLDAMSSGLARALHRVLRHERVEVWLPSPSVAGAWIRQFPAPPGERTDTFHPEEAARHGGPHYLRTQRAGEHHTLTLCARSGAAVLAVVRVLGRELPAPDPDLSAGLERVGRMLADFLERLSMLRSLQESEARYRERSAELESLYAALQRVESELRELDRQKDDFLAMLGHELRNPMAAIRNATELLGHVDGPAPQVERLQSVFERQTEQMTKLVDGLLDVSRVARGKIELQVAPVDVKALASQVVDDRRQQYPERQLSLHLPEHEVWALADRVRLVQILDNLVSNACKFTPPGGHVTVQVALSGTSGTLTVCDDGMGIEPEALPRLFEPFRQGRAALGPSQGLGLGLALVRGLVELHGFELEVHSDGAGHGSLFRVAFPLSSVAEAPALESRFEPRGLELLLVEDNTDVAETLTELLIASGHRVEAVGSAERALASLRARAPAVVLCDIGLPGMDGMALARRVRNDPTLPGVQLVAMTGYSDAATRDRIEEAGFHHLLIKPVQLNALNLCLGKVDRERSRLNRS